MQIVGLARCGGGDAKPIASVLRFGFFFPFCDALLFLLSCLLRLPVALTIPKCSVSACVCTHSIGCFPRCRTPPTGGLLVSAKLCSHSVLCGTAARRTSALASVEFPLRESLARRCLAPFCVSVMTPYFLSFSLLRQTPLLTSLIRSRLCTAPHRLGTPLRVVCFLIHSTTRRAYVTPPRRPLLFACVCACPCDTFGTSRLPSLSRFCLSLS